MREEITEKWISGFWRRIGALFIDTIILGIAGLILGLFFERIFVEIGAWGRLIGFSIALAYFGIMNSAITGGQTVGKKILKIKVVDSNNTSISIGKSFVRYSVFSIPFFLNGAQIASQEMQSLILYPFSLIVFGGFFSIVYLYVFNRVTRQTLHDLVVGTFVVNADVEKEAVGKVWNVHLVVVAFIFLVALLGPVFTASMTQNTPFKEMISAQSALLKEPNVMNATVFTGSTTVTSSDNGPVTTTFVRSQVFIDNNNVGDVERARELAFTVIANYPETLQKDFIVIILTYGYDIGIASKWAHHTHRFNPGEF